MEILIKATQLLLSLSILVILHELGHFIPAKLFKTRVEKFYLFFDPWFSLVKKKIGGTEYGIGWLPLGGYVKISGMIDESMDKEQLAKDPEPWEFRAKPAWQRLIIMLGGVTVNVILAIFIYVFTLFAWGDQYLPTENATYGVHCDSLGLAAGFQHGDKIISVNNVTVDRFSQVVPEIILNDAQTVEVLRNEALVVVSLSEEVKEAMLAKHTLFSLGIPFVFDKFVKHSPAETAGAQIGDRLVAANGIPLTHVQDVHKLIPEFSGDSVQLLLDRKGNAVIVTAYLSDDKIGVFPQNDISKIFEMEQVEYSFLEAIPAGFNKTGTTISNYLKQFKLIKKSPDSVGGFITIGNIFPAQWDWERFWSLTAFLSIMLAVLNILPIPALDGGHVVFLLYEMVTGRKPHEKVLEYAQITGMILLLGLLIYANGNDIIRLFS